METITIRNIGKEIGNFFSDLGTAILDLDLSALFTYIFWGLVIIGTPVFMYFSLVKFIRNFKEHHIFFKIVYPVGFVGFAYVYLVVIFILIKEF